MILIATGSLRATIEYKSDRESMRERYRKPERK